MIRHYIIEENIQYDVEKLTRSLQKNLIVNTRNFSSKLDIFTKLKKRIVFALVFLVIKPKYPIYVSKITFKKHTDLSLI